MIRRSRRYLGYHCCCQNVVKSQNPSSCPWTVTEFRNSSNEITNPWTVTEFRNSSNEITNLLLKRFYGFPPGADGFHQENLDQWAKLAGSKEPAINAKLFTREDPKTKDMYRSPHAVGRCYLARWHLLKQLNHRPPKLKPDLYFVFKDDALCVPDLINRTLESTIFLPPDWDIFYVGGKLFAYFDNFTEEVMKNTAQQRDHDFCSGAYGMGESPFAPDGSRQISEDQPYWRTKYLTNTYAYVVNPQRVGRILEVLRPQSHVPIDIRLADAMKAGKLHAYMTPQKLCLAREFHVKEIKKPKPWKGYFAYLNGTRWNYRYVWQTMVQQDNCTY